MSWRRYRVADVSLTGGFRTWMIIMACALAACGGTSDPAGGGSASDPGGPPASPETTNDSSGDNAPVTATVDGTTYGYPAGTCDVGGDRVQVHAARMDVLATVDVRWLGDGGRETFDVVHTGGQDPQPPTPFDLHASPNDADTTWDVSVDGNSAVIVARMLDRSPAGAGGYHDVTINVQCNERGFGGFEAPETNVPQTELPVATSAGESAIALELGGTTYSWTYPGCAAAEASGFVAVNPALDRLFVTAGEMTLSLADGTTWTATGAQLSISGGSATWTGTMASTSGSQPATLTIAC